MSDASASTPAAPETAASAPLKSFLLNPHAHLEHALAVGGPVESIQVYFDKDLLAKWNDPAYAHTLADARLITGIQQILRNQEREILPALESLAQNLQTLADQVAKLVAAIPPKPGPATGGEIRFESEPPSESKAMSGKAGGKMKFAFPDNQTAVATLELHDAMNVPTTNVDAPPAWTADQPFITVTPAADGLSCTFKVDPGQSPAAGDVPVHASVTAAGASFVLDDKLTLQGGPATGGVMSFVTQ